MARQFNIFKSIDKWAIFYYILLIVAGWFAVYGASYSYDQESFFDFSHRASAQLIWMCISCSVAFIITLTNSRIYNAIAMLGYWVMMLLLVITIFIAPDIKGSHSWLPLGPFSIQPAEFAKFITALALAKMMSSPSFELKTFKGYFKVAGLILLPVAIIILQSETGSALVFLAFTMAIYREGLPGLFPALGGLAIILFVVVLRYSGVNVYEIPNASLGIILGSIIVLISAYIFIFIHTKRGPHILYLASGSGLLLALAFIIHYLITPLNFAYIFIIIALLNSCYLFYLAVSKWRRNYTLIAAYIFGGLLYCYATTIIFNKILEPHQQKRIMVVLGMKDDPHGAGYNVNQARIAIGSGGLKGKGYLQGTQTQLKYVPEQETDFIFCTIGEEFGFIGSTLLLIIYVLFIFRLISIAERQEDTFTRVYGYCVISVFCFHLMINIGMVLGLAPVIGIPLPFFSYGGSSLLSFTILLFIFLKLDSYRIERTR